MSFEILDWDSAFFGFKVAKISIPVLNPSELFKILEEMRRLDVSLVYWPSEDRDEKSRKAAEECGGFLADRKKTYVANFTENLKPLSDQARDVEFYDRNQVSSELRSLAIASGVYSRFKVDPRFPPELFRRLYYLWVEKSVQGVDGQRVLVCRSDEKITGMVTVGPQSNRAAIGLIAVDPEFSGKGIGTALVEASQNWAVQNHFRVGQVITQATNSAACALYEKCGYTVEKITRFYHFWLKEI
jgi:dTDP-4-amino-4,6-dideoxy-D-galactose acyltransferase